MSIFSFFLYSRGSRPAVLKCVCTVSYCVSHPELLKTTPGDSDSGDLEGSLGISLFRELPKWAFECGARVQKHGCRPAGSHGPAHTLEDIVLGTEFALTGDPHLRREGYRGNAVSTCPTFQWLLRGVMCYSILISIWESKPVVFSLSYTL